MNLNIKYLILAVVIGFLSAILWANRENLNILYRVYQLKQNNHSEILSHSSTDLAIHRYFLKFGIYVPREDIIESTITSINFPMHNSCPKGKIQIWIPFKIQVPLFGEKVLEWCMILP